MTEQQAHQLLAQAERAATAGDLAAADELLRGAARLQEEELGPLHPDLANTLNNLAIIAERNGSASEAETLYRRAASIAAAALPSDDPMVIESRQNLEDFCRARGLPVDLPPAVTPLPAITPPPVVAPPAVVTPAAVVAPAQPLPETRTGDGASRRGLWLATAAIVLVAALILVWRPWSSREVPAAVPTPAPEPVAAPAPETIPVPPKAAAPVPPRDDRRATTNRPPAPGEVTVANAQLCRSFSTSGANWRCDPIGQSVTPGSITFYTRVRSPRETTVIHRWLQGATLRQSVMLKVQANTTEGYRTYSRLTLDEGNWRMEVRREDGSLLHEQRLTVR